MKDSDVGALVERIRSAFAAVRHPGDAFLAGSRDGCEPTLRRFIASAITVLAVVALLAGADDWPGAQPYAVFATTGEYFVRIVPNTPYPPKPSARAHALLYRLDKDRSYRLVKDITLLNEWSPVNVLVARSGAFIAFDNWHRAGFGDVVAIYAPSGTLVRSYQLEQLYRPAQIEKIPESVSSRHWRCTPYHFVEPEEQRSVYVPEALGGYFVFTLENGAWRYEKGARRDCTAPPLPR